jgi:hypothetical protein
LFGLHYATVLTMNQVANKQAGFATRWLLIIVVILALIGGFVFYESQKENTPQTNQEPETALTEEATEDQQSTLPAGFTQFSDNDTGITFVYPSAWGTATMVPDDFSHEGESYQFFFAANPDVLAGVKSSDFVYTDGPRGGLGAIGFGYPSFEEQVANISQANQQRLNGNEGYGTTIIDQGEDFLLFADADLGSVGYFVSLLLRANTPEYGGIELIYPSSSSVAADDSLENILDAIDIEYIEEFNAIISANQTP